MQKQTLEINGTLLADTAIVHGLISDSAKNKGRENKENNINPARRMEQFLKVEENGDYYLKKASIPVVSGNACRGIARRVLVEHSFDVLDVSIEEIFKDVPNHSKVVHDVWFFLNNGGLTPKGCKALPSSLAAYDKITTIPWVGLFGGVYHGHQFEGSASFGILYPLLKENVYLYRDDLGLDDEFIAKLPEASVLEKLDTARFTRRSNPRDNSAGIKNTEADDQKGSTDAMIYGSEYIPAGIQFASINRCVSHDPDVIKTFKAAITLFVKNGIIGGKSAAGFGRVHPSHGFDFDMDAAIKEYDEMLLARKDDILDAIRTIPTGLNFRFDDKDKDAKKEEKDGEEAA